MSQHEHSKNTYEAAPTALDRATLVVAAVALLGAFMTLIDTTVVFVALEPLARDFGVSLTTIQWVATAYTLALAGVFPISGWAADRFGAKRIYVVGLGIFVLGSALCAIAWSAGSLIAFRLLQGVGGGIVLPTVTTIVAHKAGPRRRGRVMGILGVPLLLAPVLGPIFGGWLLDEVSWRWVFLINLPIGAVAIPLALRFLDRDEPQPTHRLDWLGIGLLSPALTLILFGLAGSAHGGFDVLSVWLPIALGAVLGAAFAIHAWGTEVPLIDVKRFARTRAGAAVTTQLLVTIALFGALLLMPLYFQTVRGASAAEAGLLIAPWGLGVMATLPVAGVLSDRYGPGRLPIVGTVVLVIGLGPFAFLTPDTPYALLCVAGFVLGIGDGLVFVPVTSAVLAMVPYAAVARTSTAVSIITEVAASIGTAGGTVLLAGASGGVGVEPSAAAFGTSFAWMVGPLVLALVPAAILATGKARGPNAPAGAFGPTPLPGTRRSLPAIADEPVARAALSFTAEGDTWDPRRRCRQP
jgi:EmrB/QacA subfamily drug resistance transporter